MFHQLFLWANRSNLFPCPSSESAEKSMMLLCLFQVGMRLEISVELIFAILAQSCETKFRQTSENVNKCENLFRETTKKLTIHKNISREKVDFTHFPTKKNRSTLVSANFVVEKHKLPNHAKINSSKFLQIAKIYSAKFRNWPICAFAFFRSALRENLFRKSFCQRKFVALR